MIERQVDVVEWVANLVRDRCGESTDHGAFFSLVQLHFEFAGAAELSGHFVERAGECSHLVEPIRRNLNIEVSAGNFSCSIREFFDRTREAPDEESGHESRDKQHAERVERGTRRLSLQNIGQYVRRVEDDDDEAPSLVSLHWKIDGPGFTEVDIGRWWNPGRELFVVFVYWTALLSGSS